MTISRKLISVSDLFSIINEEHCMVFLNGNNLYTKIKSLIILKIPEITQGVECTQCKKFSRPTM